ncbi:mycofactocin biosynthesis peptidyl-dipeptidase MftE [Tsukamurella soli]
MLGDATWPQIDAEPPAVLIVPVGAVEQHGPHLPLDTDTRVAVAVARTVAAATPGTVCAPALAYGASGEHEGFPGTVSIGTEALAAILLEYGRSACRWVPRLLLINGHGGNAQAVAGAVRRLRYEARDVAWAACDPRGSDPHAGFAETSMLLHLCPESVRLSMIEVGDTRPLTETLPLLRAGGTRAVTANGILGDPRAATAADGLRLFDELTARIVAATRTWAPDEHGRLKAGR